MAAKQTPITGEVLPAVINPGEQAVATRERVEDPFAGIVFEDDGVNEGEPSFRLLWPEVKLIQGVTRGIDGSNKHIGEFYHTDWQEFQTDLHVIPLNIREQRAFFEDGVEAPGCVSVDGIAPLPNQPLWKKPFINVRNRGSQSQEGMWQPELCVECPYAQFAEDGTPPLCGSSMLMMVKREDDSFAQLRIGPSGLKPVRQAIRKLIGGRRRLPIFAAGWTFSSTTAEKGTKKWEQLTVQTYPLDVAEVVAMNVLVAEMRGQVNEVATQSATNLSNEGDEAIEGVAWE